MSNREEFQAAARKLAIETSIAEVTSRLMKNAAPVVDAGLPALTGADRRLPKRADSKTKPRRPLRPRGLAIARLLAQGKMLTEIAETLGITRQSVWRWSMQPDVKLEVQRVHAEMIRSHARAG